VDPSLIVGALMGAGIIGFLLFIRFKDLPQPAPVSPFRHLDERKTAIYENLRDLQFEYRLNKLSDEDYQTTKLELQKELARVLAETDRIKSQTSAPAASQTASERTQASSAKRNICPACGASFEKRPKFCPECGKPIGAVAS
jgi:rubrerythrin